MATTTNLNLEKPIQGTANWHIPINSNFDKIDAAVSAAYKNVWQVGNDTYLSANAKYVTNHWERWDNSKPAKLIKVLHNGEVEIYNCSAGSGTITWYKSGYGNGENGIQSHSGTTSISGLKQYTRFNDNGFNTTITAPTIIFAQESITISGTVTVNPIAGTGGTIPTTTIGAGGSSNYTKYPGLDGIAFGGNAVCGSFGYGGNGGEYPSYGGAGGKPIEPLNIRNGFKNNSITDVSSDVIITYILDNFKGSGGGKGGAVYPGSHVGYLDGGNGGNGGGVLILCAPIINIVGSINAKGQNGSNGVVLDPSWNAGSGGGGGSGGMVALFYETLNETGSISVAGGAAGGIGVQNGYTATPAPQAGGTGVIVRKQY